MAGLSVQVKAKEDEIALIAEEAVAQDALYAKNLTSLSQVLALKREAVRLNGEFDRTAFQLRGFADVLDAGTVHAFVDDVAVAGPPPAGRP